MILLIELYLFISLSVTLTIFQGHSNVKEFPLEILCCYLVKLKLCMIVNFISYIMNIQYFWLSHVFRGDNWRNVWFDEKECCAFLGHGLSKVFQTLHFLKLAWGLLIHTRFDDLDLYQGHMYLRIINCKLVLTHMKNVNLCISGS